MAVKDLFPSNDMKHNVDKIYLDTMKLISKQPASESTGAMKKILASLPAENSKLKPLLQLQIGIDDFIKSTIHAGAEPTSSSGSNVDDITQVCIPESSVLSSSLKPSHMATVVVTQPQSTAHIEQPSLSVTAIRGNVDRDNEIPRPLSFMPLERLQ